MSKNLVIVESPAKAKTIEGYLGKDFTVKSSIGHIRDLPKKGGMAIDIENGFKPKYVISEDKKKVVSELKAEVKKADTIWLATDEDREGEAIAWHLTEALGLDKKDTKRIVFHEITKKAITHAVETPRALDQNLINAQQARRILDRLVGFELSPILWKKIRRSAYNHARLKYNYRTIAKKLSKRFKKVTISSNNQQLIDLRVDRNPYLSCIQISNGQYIPNVSISDYQSLNTNCN